MTSAPTSPAARWPTPASARCSRRRRPAAKETHFSDIARYAPSDDLPSRFTATAVVDEQGQTLGVLAIQSANELNAIVQYNPQLGETGTSFLIGEDLLLRTD